MLLRAEQGLEKIDELCCQSRILKGRKQAVLMKRSATRRQGLIAFFFFFHFGAAFGSEFGERCTEHGESMKRISVSTVSVVVAVVALLLSRESPYPSRIARRALNIKFSPVFNFSRFLKNFENFKTFKIF